MFGKLVKCKDINEQLFTKLFSYNVANIYVWNLGVECKDINDQN